MRKILVSLVVVAGALCLHGPAQAQTQQQCPPGQSGNFPYCQTIPAACAKLTSKLSFARARFNAALRTLNILAPITKLASGRVALRLRGAGQTVDFTAPIDSAHGRVRTTKSISGAQSALGTGILTIAYLGDADTRPQVVRLRAANNPAKLSLTRPTITPAGVLQASGSVVSSARGVVRVQLEFVNGVSGQTITLERKATISSGRWSLAYQLPAAIQALIASRCGTVHSYTLFTGYQPRLIRGEIKSFQVLAAR
jgi:hypothetical protein